jgi:hypothetical protein
MWAGLRIMARNALYCIGWRTLACSIRIIHKNANSASPGLEVGAFFWHAPPAPKGCFSFALFSSVRLLAFSIDASLNQLAMASVIRSRAIAGMQKPPLKRTASGLAICSRSSMCDRELFCRGATMPGQAGCCSDSGSRTSTAATIP